MSKQDYAALGAVFLIGGLLALTAYFWGWVAFLVALTAVLVSVGYTAATMAASYRNEVQEIVETVSKELQVE